MAINLNLSTRVFPEGLEAKVFERYTKKPETLEALTQLPSLLPATHLCFSESLNPFCSEKPFEFGGKSYTHPFPCAYAQRYTDQPSLMDRCSKLCDLEQLGALADLNPMTKTREAAWKNPEDIHNNQRGVWMNTFRAQFGQIPELKEALMETGEAFLACHDFNPVLSDRLDGTGQNLLGRCLMQLRGEYGGKGEVEPGYSYKWMIYDSKQPTFLHPFIPDIWRSIIAQCNATSVVALSCVDRNLCHLVPHHLSVLAQETLEPIMKICGPNLQILNMGEGPLLPFSRFELVKGCHTLMSLVEDNAGLTLLTLSEGITFNHVVQMATDVGITVKGFLNLDLTGLGDEPIRQPYMVLITNNVFFNSRNKSCSEQQELVRKVGCEMPELLEYVVLCVLMQRDCQICLYGRKDPWTSWTYGRSSTQVGGHHLIVGGSTPGLLFCCGSRNYDNKEDGAGGRRKL